MRKKWTIWFLIDWTLYKLYAKTIYVSTCDSKDDDPREKGIFEDVDVKFQAQMCLKFDVDVFEHAFSPRIVTLWIRYRLVP